MTSHAFRWQCFLLSAAREEAINTVLLFTILLYSLITDNKLVPSLLFGALTWVADCRRAFRRDRMAVSSIRATSALLFLLSDGGGSAKLTLAWPLPAELLCMSRFARPSMRAYVLMHSCRQQQSNQAAWQYICCKMDWILCLEGQNFAVALTEGAFFHWWVFTDLREFVRILSALEATADMRHAQSQTQLARLTACTPAERLK